MQRLLGKGRKRKTNGRSFLSFPSTQSVPPQDGRQNTTGMGWPRHSRAPDQTIQRFANSPEIKKGDSTGDELGASATRDASCVV